MDRRWPLAALAAALTLMTAPAAFAAGSDPPASAGWHGREIRDPLPRATSDAVARFPRGWSAGGVARGTGYASPTARGACARCSGGWCAAATGPARSTAGSARAPAPRCCGSRSSTACRAPAASTPPASRPCDRLEPRRPAAPVARHARPGRRAFRRRRRRRTTLTVAAVLLALRPARAQLIGWLRASRACAGGPQRHRASRLTAVPPPPAPDWCRRLRRTRARPRPRDGGPDDRGLVRGSRLAARYASCTTSSRRTDASPTGPGSPRARPDRRRPRRRASSSPAWAT